MRILHTADWHLGRRLHGVDLIEDQSHALDQLIVIAKDARPELVIVAGDLFDRSQPPTDALRLLDDAWARLVDDLGLRVIAIAGNHDSPTRIDYGRALFARRGLHLWGGLDPAASLLLDDRFGAIEFAPIPYAEPAAVADALGDGATLADHDAAFAALMARRPPPRAARQVAIGHLFVQGGGASESERPLAIGGIESVRTAHFRPFSYAALGHLHRPQRLGEGRIVYAGSLLKYSASEADHAKSIALVDIDGAGAIDLERVPITPKRDLKLARAPFDDLLRAPRHDDFLIAEYEDPGHVFDPIGRLRARFPNVLSVVRAPDVEARALETASGARAPESADLGRLFRAFFAHAGGVEPSAADERAINDAVARFRAHERAG